MNILLYSLSVQVLVSTNVFMENIFIQLYMCVLYVVIVTYKSSLAGRGLYNTTVFILMYTHVNIKKCAVYSYCSHLATTVLIRVITDIILKKCLFFGTTGV